MHRWNPTGPVLGALLLAALAQTAVGGLISDVSAIPNPFSPNADGKSDEIAFEYTLAESAWVDVLVEDSLGLTVRHWSEDQEPGAHSFLWGGEDDWGVPQPDGEYTLAILANSIREVEVAIILDTIAPAVDDLLVVPSRFSPDGDGMADSLRVSFVFRADDETDFVSVSVRDSAGDDVRTLLEGSGIDTVTIFWGGTDAAGAAAADTLYRVAVETGDLAQNSFDTDLLVDLDIDPPALDADLPDTALVLAVNDTFAVLTGWAYDRSGVSAVEVSVGGGAWEAAALTEDPLIDGKVSWEHTVACTGCVDGSTDEVAAIRVRARDGVATSDGLGHMNGTTGDHPIVEFDVVYDVAPPVHESSYVVDDDNVYTAGETVTIRTEWDASGYDVEAFFYQVDSTFNPASVDVDPDGDGRYEIRYTISTANTFTPPYTKRVRIKASDYFHAVEDSSVTITVEEGEAGDLGGLSVDKNLFYPLDGEAVSISFGAYSGTVCVEILNLAGTLVWSKEKTVSAGDPGISWGGTNAEGKTVASGVYFLRIQTERDEEVRKVAVVK
jgi:flagellar hook assembly protein FlgD